ncbi:D-arabinitol dehydrogenase 1 [Stagonosporopsis vannaccii]|nr:D-arabinitol dehydrogenase 1 [Stagonosporopsis vannaccii]
MPTTEVSGSGDAGARPGERCVEGLPKKMKALQYSAPEQFAVVEIDVPEIRDNEVLVKITACGVCGTDLHYHKGHEVTGTIAALGRSVASRSLALGTAVAVDPLLPCDTCTFCVTRRPLLCTSLTAYGGNAPGGFAQYAAFPSKVVHALGTRCAPHAALSAREAVLLEPAACALHGLERMLLRPGARVLLFGCGPTGLLLAQLIRLNGAAHLTIASKGGVKLDVARRLGVADAFVEIPDAAGSAAAAFSALGASEPEGWDVVVEATGAVAVLEQALAFVRKGGKLVVYGVYAPEVKVAWSPFRIWENEITVLASFCSMQHLPQVLEYVRSGRLRLAGVVDREYRVEEWGECLEAVRRGECVKAAIVFD